MTQYYQELASHPDDARIVGWESRLAQLVRYEVVRSLMQPQESLLDLGAGIGDLARYLGHTHAEATYSGIEARAEFVSRALTKEPPVVLSCGEAFPEAPVIKADIVAVIGALVDGRSLADRTQRFSRLRHIIASSTAQARRLAIFVFARQDRIEADLMRRLDPALGGIERNEIPWLLPPDCDHAIVEDLLPNDLVLVVAKPRHTLPPIPPAAAIRASALAHPMAHALPAAAHIRFHIDLGETETAQRLLTKAEAEPSFSPDAAWHLLKARLSLALNH